jgi:hypothetical protein
MAEWFIEASVSNNAIRNTLDFVSCAGRVVFMDFIKAIGLF